MTTAPSPPPRPIVDRILAALMWVAAFSFASGLFLCLTLLLRQLPPVEPVAIGRVTIERASKLKDYLTALLFLVSVPPLTIALRALGQRIDGRLRRAVGRMFRESGWQALTSLLFLIPFLFSPFFFLTTGKVGWVILLPIAASQIGPRLVLFAGGSRWLRQLLRPELLPHHGLIIIEAVSWIVFRYVATGRRIAHIPTLFLEIGFVIFFIAVFWAAMVMVTRVAALALGRSHDHLLQRVAVAGLPFVILPFLILALTPVRLALAFVVGFFGLALMVALRYDTPVDGRPLRQLAIYVLVPLLLYGVSYASTAHLSQWIDLFHRGESLGPASDYLRGKVPYRDVFVLHGMLEDGLLDAWLMEVFGRKLEIALARPAIVGSFLAPALFLLGVAIFDSIPLGLLCVAMGSWTTAENDRTLLQVLVVTLLWMALRQKQRWAAVASGMAAGLVLFFSYEIGLYSILGTALAISLMAFVMRRQQWDGLPFGQTAMLFLAGLLVAASPFVIYLAARNALGDFLTTSFVTIPGIIDAVWSLPFPDLITPFRKTLSLHTVSEFILFEKFHLILSFVVIAIAAVYVLHRWRRRRLTDFDLALLVLTVFAALTQRSALGRAEFRHQYFSAFLIGPMLVMLMVLFVRRIRMVWKESDDGGRGFVVLILVLFLLTGGVLLWVPDLISARLDDLVHYQARVYRTRPDPAAEQVMHRIHSVVYEIDKVTTDSDPLFDFSNQPALYFFADRPNPTRFYQVPILSPKRFQAETITELERAKPKIVLRRSPEGFDEMDGIPNDVRAQAVAAYLDDHYRFWKNVRGVELWRRLPRSTPIDLRAYLRLIHVPPAKEFNEYGPRARLIFPAVGSLEGGGGTYWRSDLVLHNPFKEAMLLRLRYVAGETRIDQPVTLRGGQSVRWDDVVRTLFFAPGTRGVLWIEHRAWRQPVTRVRTYDTGHGSKGSLDNPLTARDAASAYADLTDLTIVGIPSGTTRRINLGVVNVGNIPATFRITVRNKFGRRVGGAIELGLPEDESFLQPDAERELGVFIDETMTVHVEMIAGTCVAFATSIDVFTGDHLFIPAVPSLRP